MANAHNIGIALFGAALLIIGNVITTILGLVMLAWGIGKSLNYYSLQKHTTHTTQSRLRKIQ